MRGQPCALTLCVRAPTQSLPRQSPYTNIWCHWGVKETQAQWVSVSEPRCDCLQKPQAKVREEPKRKVGRLLAETDIKELKAGVCGYLCRLLQKQRQRQRKHSKMGQLLPFKVREREKLCPPSISTLGLTNLGPHKPWASQRRPCHWGCQGRGSQHHTHGANLHSCDRGKSVRHYLHTCIPRRAVHLSNMGHSTPTS